MRRKLWLEVELDDAMPGAMLDVLKALAEDLDAMLDAGTIRDYGFALAGTDTHVVYLSEPEKGGAAQEPVKAGGWADDGEPADRERREEAEK